MEAWRGLADVVAEGERLENLEKELLLRDSLLLGANGDNHAKEKVERQLAWIREARERNVGELARAVRLAERGVRWRTRTCHWLSGLKAGLIRDILPLLVEVGKREFARVKKEAGGGGGGEWAFVFFFSLSSIFFSSFVGWAVTTTSNPFCRFGCAVTVAGSDISSSRPSIHPSTCSKKKSPFPLSPHFPSLFLSKRNPPPTTNQPTNQLTFPPPLFLPHTADSDFKSPISAFDDDDDDDDDDDETESDNTQSQQQKQQRTLKRKQKQGAELQTQTQMQTQTGGAKRRMTNAAPAPAVAEDAALPGKKKVRAAAPRKKTTRTRMAGKKKG